MMIFISIEKEVIRMVTKFITMVIAIFATANDC